MSIQLNGSLFLKPMYQFNIAGGAVQKAQTLSVDSGDKGYEITLSKQSIAGKNVNASMDDVAKTMRSYFDQMDELKARMKKPGIEMGFGNFYDKITDLSQFENQGLAKHYGASFYDSSDYDSMFIVSDDELLQYAAHQLERDYARANGAGVQLPTPAGTNSNGTIQRLDFSYETPDKNITAIANNLKNDFSLAGISGAIIRATDPYAKELGTMSLSFAGVTSPYHFDQKIENASALYAFYQDQATRNLGGKKLDEALKTIDTAFASALDRIADSIIGNGEFTGADAEGIRESVNMLFHEKAAEYSDILHSKDFDLGLKGSANGWAAESADYVTAKLIQHGRDVEGGVGSVESEAKYSVSDLKAMVVAQNYSSTSTVTAVKSEEDYGVEFGIKALYMEKLLQGEGITDAARETMRASFEASMQKALDDADETLLWQSGKMESTGGLGPIIVGKINNDGSEYHYDPLDMEAIQNTFNRVLETLQAEDFQSALTNTLRDIDKEYQQKLLDQYESGYVQERNQVTLIGDTLLNSFELYGFADKLNSAMKNLQGADEVINKLDFVNTYNDLWGMQAALDEVQKAKAGASNAQQAAGVTEAGNVYYTSKYDTSVGYLDKSNVFSHDFFNSTYDIGESIQQWAKDIANEWEKYADNKQSQTIPKHLEKELYTFAERALEYLGGHYNELLMSESGERIHVNCHNSESTIQSFADQIMQSVYELAGNIANGRGNGLDDVSTKLTISEDFEMTLGDVLKVQKFVGSVMNEMGNSTVDEYAKLGMAASAVKMFAQNSFDGETASKINSLFEQQVENVFEWRRFNPLKKEMQKLFDEHNKQMDALHPPVRDTSGLFDKSQEEYDYFAAQPNTIKTDTLQSSIYHSFANMNTSSIDDYKKAFAQALSQFSNSYGNWYDFSGWDAGTKDRAVSSSSANLTNIFNKLTALLEQT